MAASIGVTPGWSQPLRADLDGDGRLERLVPDTDAPHGFSVTREEGRRISVPGLPTFPPLELLILDWNADTTPDVLTVRRDRPPALWVNDGAGAFQRDDAFDRLFPEPILDAWTADLTGDDLPDLMCRRRDSTLVLVERHSDLQIDLTYWHVSGRDDVLARDADADGRLDIVVGDRVRHRRADAWSNTWEPRPPSDAEILSLRLIGPPDNEDALGAKVVVTTDGWSTTRWVHVTPEDGALEFVAPENATEIRVDWPDGLRATLPADATGELTVFARPPAPTLAGVWSNPVDGTHLRWRMAEPVPEAEQALWEVYRSQSLDAPLPATFTNGGSTIEYGLRSHLLPGEYCLVAYAGRSLASSPVHGEAVTFMPWAVRTDTIPDALDIAIADADNDGVPELIARLSPEFDDDEPKFALGSGDPIEPQAAAHWWEVVRPAGNSPDDALSAYDIVPLDVIATASGDLTGDGRPDLATLSSGGEITVYQGSDGRPTGLHLRGDTPVGPFGPGDRALIPILNPSDAPLSISEIRLSDGLIAGEEVPPTIEPGGTGWIEATIAPGTHSALAANVGIVSPDVDGGATVMPVLVQVGLPLDAETLDLVCDLGVVQRDSVVTDSVAAFIPWVRLPADGGPELDVGSGEAIASAWLDSISADTLSMGFSFRALAVGNVSLSYPLLNGSVTIVAASVDTISPPPVMPTASVSGDTVSISWAAVDVEDLKRYEVVQRNDLRERTWSTELDTLWTTTGLAEGERRSYVVYAVDVTGNRTPSDEISLFRPDRTPPVVDLLEPHVGDLEVDVRQRLVISVSDELSDVLPESLRVWIGDELLEGWSTTGEFDSRNLQIVYQPDEWPLDAAIDVYVAAADSASPPNRTVWFGSFVTVADTIIPEMRWVGEAPVLGRGGILTAAVDIPPDRQLVSARLITRAAGTSETETIVASVLERLVEVDLPPALVPMSGFFYRWEIETDRRRYVLPDHWQSMSMLAPEDGLFWPGSSTPGTGRALVSLPVRLDDEGALPELVRWASDELPTAAAHWWDALDQRWIPIEDVADAGSGNSLVVTWHENAPVLQVESGATVPLDSAQQIELLPGWNLVGQPFTYPIAWSDIQAANEGAPISGPWVERDGLRLAEILEPWDATWVHLGGRRPLVLDVPAKDTLSATIARSIDTMDDYEPIPAWAVDADGWGTDESFLLTVSARSLEASIRDVAVGWNDFATDEWDLLDIPVPPSPDSVLLVRMSREGWGEQSGDYATDVRRPASGGVWHIFVDANSDGPIALELAFADELPPGMQASLVDLMTRDSVRIDRDGITYELRDLARFPQREFVIAVGDQGFHDTLEEKEALTPSRLTLYQNYPNPFNGVTTISYSVPSREVGAMDMRLVVYNMLGQHVRMLYDGPASPGVYTVDWDGRDDQGDGLSSGVYFCELAWGNDRQLRRLIYLR